MKYIWYSPQKSKCPLCIDVDATLFLCCFDVMCLLLCSGIQKMNIELCADRDIRLQIFLNLLFDYLLSGKPPARVANGLDPDQVRCFVRPDLGRNYLQSLSASDEGTCIELIMSEEGRLVWVSAVCL